VQALAGLELDRLGLRLTDPAPHPGRA
jgi:hypothetical protein